MAKKISLLAILILFLGFTSYSQPFIGLSGEYSLNTDSNSPVEKLGGLSIRAGYTFNNKINTSIEYSFNKRIPTLVNHNFNDIGISSEYLFLQKKLKPFVGIKVAFATNKVKEELPLGEYPKETGILISPKAGICILSNEHLYINIGGSYNYFIFDNSMSFLSFNLGVDYSI